MNSIMGQWEERSVRMEVMPNHRSHKEQHTFKMGKADGNGEGMCEILWRDPHKHRITSHR